MNEISSYERSIVKCCHAGAERLTQYLNLLPAESWQSPSACAGWEVRDVVGHLAWGAELYINAISRGVKGDITPEEEYPPIGEIDRESFPPWAAQEAIVYRKRHSDQLLDIFTDRNAQLYKLIDRFKPKDWEKPCYHPLGPREVKVLIVFRAIELSLHAWDIQSVRAPSTSLLPESLPILMERIPAMLSATFRSATRLPVPLRYRFLVTGAVTGEHDLIIEGDRFRVEPIGTTDAQVTCRCDTETFALLTFNRLSPLTAITGGRLVVDGDRELMMTFGRWFKFV
jgi:uncharacterized protein (TIGR03083 family)